MKNKAKLHVIGLALAAMLAAVTAQAQTTYPRVYVAQGTGSDSNNCDTPTAPCQTLSGASGAYSKVQAGGEIIFVESGNYYTAALSITKAVSIIAPDGVDVIIQTSASLASGTGLLSVAVGTTDNVVIRGLELKYTGSSLFAVHGIKVTGGGAVQIEKCRLSGFTRTTDSAGILMQASSNVQLSVKDTGVRNSSIGVSVSSTSGSVVVKASLDRVRLDDNTVGVLAGDNASVTVRDSVAAHNTSGFKAAAATSGRVAEVNAENCLSFGNTNGLHTDGASGTTSIVRASNSTVVNNTSGLNNSTVTGNSISSRGNNTVVGNTGSETFSASFSGQ
jgi:formylmethanofuran dehydrogenase subunit D